MKIKNYRRMILMVDLTKKEKITGFFKRNKSKIIKGAIVVTSIAAGVLATKYFQLKNADKVLELVANVPEEVSECIEVVGETVKDQI